jgi:hypothetical protein
MSADTHHLIFHHKIDARVAASVTLAGMLAVLIGGAFMAIGPRGSQDRLAARNAVVRTDTKTAADTTAAATLDNHKLSPLTAAVVDHPAPPQDDATTGSGVQEDTVVLRQSDTINVSAPPDATVGAANDGVDETTPPPVEQPRRQEHRH